MVCIIRRTHAILYIIPVNKSGVHFMLSVACFILFQRHGSLLPLLLKILSVLKVFKVFKAIKDGNAYLLLPPFPPSSKLNHLSFNFF